MSLFWLLTYLFTCIIFDQSNADPDVLFAAVIFRHGDRTPVNPYPTDPWKNYSAWSIGYGQLTDKGKLQHLKLGEVFRKRYEHLLSEDYNASEIYVRSTDFDRTIMSALADLAGIYSVKKEDEWAPGLAWKPIPIHTIPLLLDNILAMKAPCPRFEYDLQKLLTGREFTEINKQLKPLYEYLTLHSGREIYSIESLGYLYDTLKIEEMYNLTLPDWTKSVYPDKMRKPALQSFLLETYTPSLMRLKAGPLIKEITQLLQIAASGKPLHNVVIYSAHDNTLANILNALGVFDPHFPEYAAHLLIELLPGVKSEDFVVRVTYQNEVMDLPECGKYCPLSRWSQLYEWLIPSNYNAECKLSARQRRKYAMFNH